jgi:M3 family oligoendopeptidase
MTSNSALPRFAEIPYVRPDLDAIAIETAKILDALEDNPSEQETIRVIREWNEQRHRYATSSSLAEVHYTQDVSNPHAKEEKTFFDKANPVVANYSIDVARRILASPHRSAIVSAFGDLFLRRLEASTRTVSPEINDLLVRESELCNQFNEIQASAKLEFEGRTYNLSSIGSFTISPNRDQRREAVRTIYAYIGQHAEALDNIYHELVQLRTEKARRLGFSSYTEFRYIEFGRIDYTAHDVEVFRSSVLEHVVPVVQRLREAQARRLGLHRVELFDEKLQFIDGNPLAHGDHDWIVERAARMYRELSPETGEFIDLMLSHDLMDLKSRDNKATGGYCTSFASYGLPFIFANFNRTTHDIEVLTHEAGHAFQAYSSRHYDVPEYRWPTAEACEIHSMSMEFLTWPWMPLFFESDSDKFFFYHLQGALLFLPYACAVDHFQHWVYANPTVTPAERNQEWSRLERLYMPWRHTDAIPEANEGRQWQFQRHIYESPFYYIDYALAQTCALQYWQAAQKDPVRTFDDYLRICRIGGSMPFLDIVAAGNLRSPFRPDTLPIMVNAVDAWLSKHHSQFLA